MDMPPMQKIVANTMNCEDILKCVFGLSGLETAILKELMEKPLTAEELGKIVARNRSTVYRSLRHLISSGLVYRDKMSLEKGGYYHLYHAVTIEQVKGHLRNAANSWYMKMVEMIETYPANH